MTSAIQRPSSSSSVSILNVTGGYLRRLFVAAKHLFDTLRVVRQNQKRLAQDLSQKVLRKSPRIPMASPGGACRVCLPPQRPLKVKREAPLI